MGYLRKSVLERDLSKLWRRTVNEFPHISNLVVRLKEAGHTTASEELLEIYNHFVEHGEKIQVIIEGLRDE